MCELVRGEPGTFVKIAVFGENTPFRALCAVAPHLLLGLRCEEEVWRGFRAPPRAQVPRPSSCKYRLYPKGRYLECETLTTRDRPRRANERVVRRASTRATKQW
eukprot:scaffold64732_cov66-Phaeocystis_antarctica.AAC.1